MPTFPPYAKILFNGYSEQRESSVLRTDMESGPAKQAKVRSRPMKIVTVPCSFASKAEYQAFILWVKNDLARGAMWFDWTDPIDGTVKQARIVGGNLEPAAPIGDAKGINGRWQVRFQIETADA